ncbi:MAG: hypothetical protein GY896_10185 [Gammaproteobacteria bacterium]|nr:hypothetical protein [Gammaproteobacteria bacterium]
MSTTDITERQQYWLDRVQAADAFNGTLVEYAKVEGLKVKDLYQWKTILMKRGFLAKPVPSAFVPVEETVRTNKPAQAALVLPNGYRIEITGGIDADNVKTLVLAASELG